MSNNQSVIKAVHAAWEHEPRINLHTHPVTMGLTQQRDEKPHRILAKLLK